MDIQFKKYFCSSTEKRDAHPYLATKQFVKRSKNSIITVEPPVVILEVDAQATTKPVEKMLKIINHSSRSQRCVIMPLQSQQFTLSYRRQDCIPPGLCLSIKVTYTPNKRLYDRAWLQIYCFDDVNLMILLEAVIQNPCAHFPKCVDFGTVPLCKSVTYNIHLPSIVGKTVVFGSALIQSHSDVSVTPQNGVVNDGGCNIKVTFRPTQYSTIFSKLNIFIPVFSVVPFSINIIGTCKPNIKRENKLIEYHNCIRSFLKKCHKEVNDTAISKYKHEILNQIEYIPKKQKSQARFEMRCKSLSTAPLNTVFGVATFLNMKEPKTLSPHELLGPVGRNVAEDIEVNHVNENTFKQECLIHLEDNKKTLLHHDTLKLGQNHNHKFQDIIEEHISNWHSYKEMTTITSNDVLCAKMLRQKNIKNPEKFNKYKLSNQFEFLWFIRYPLISRFIQLVRQVIIQNRLKRCLHKLKLTQIQQLNEQVDDPQI